MKRDGQFPILALPRELRDEIYSYTLGSQVGLLKPMYDSVNTRAHHCFRPDRRSSRRLQSSGPLSTSAILFSNLQLHHEAMETVYRENMFFVTMDLTSPIFRTQKIKKGDERCAVPFGWNLSKITKLCLRLDLGDSSQDSVQNTLTSFEFSDLGAMKKLVTLRLVVTVWEQYTPGDPPMPFLDDIVGDDGISRHGSLGFREMVKGLWEAMPGPIRKLEFGLTFGSDEARPDDWSSLRSVCSVPGDTLRSVFDELRNSDPPSS